MAEQEIQTEAGEGSQPQYTEAEQKAMAAGWVPKDQWEGEGKWRDAESFNDRGELFSKIDAQNRELKNTRQALTALEQHYKKVAETEYQRALETLREKKQAAIIDEDPALQARVDEAIMDLKLQRQQVQSQPAPAEAGPNPEFVAWENRNSWYRDSGPMRAYADQLGRELASEGKSAPEVLRMVAESVRKEFPQKFQNTNRDRAPAVEGGGGNARVAKGHVELTEVETQIMKKLVGQGVLTKDQYIADIRKQRERQ